MENSVLYTVRISRPDGDALWVVDGPGSNFLAAHAEQAGWWTDLEVVRDIITWWEKYFDGQVVNIEIVKSETTFTVLPDPIVDIAEVGHG